MLEMFDLQFDMAIQYGMTPHQFWNDCPSLFYRYKKAFENNLKIKDNLNWCNGYYVALAIASCFSKGSPYPKSPIFFAKEEEEQNVETMKEQFEQMASLINRKFNK